MNVATLKISSTNDQALDSLQTTLNLIPKATWKKGDSAPRGSFYQSSGRSFTIADAASPGELIKLIRTELTTFRNSTVCFSGAELLTELSVGITVGDSLQFVASLEFTPTDLSLLAEMGIHLVICAYPTSDEANEKS